MLQGKMPNARSINNMDTDPREFILDMMAKTFGWKYTEQYSGVRFQRRHDYVESFQGGYKLQEHCGECGAMDHVDEKMDGRKKFSGKQAKKDNEDRRAAQRKKLGILGPNEEVEVDEAKCEFDVICIFKEGSNQSQ